MSLMMQFTKSNFKLSNFACCLLISYGGMSQLLAAPQQETPLAPLPQAHAHNDYLHDRPLLDALEQGFTSVEADVFLVEGDLWVAHTRSELEASRTLRNLYLEPLRKRIQANSGSVFGTDQQLTLLIDFKEQGAETYRVLDGQLEEYAELFTHVDASGEQHTGPVIAIISGDRPVDAIAADATRYVGIDGRLSDLQSELSPSLLPLISDNWNSHFQWRGRGELPEADRLKLKSVVDQVHAQNRRIRFWAVPDFERSWQILRDAKVDLINTDNLDGLSSFLRKSPTGR